MDGTGRNVSMGVMAADYATAAKQALAEKPGYVLHPRSEANEELARQTGNMWTDDELCEAACGKR